LFQIDEKSHLTVMWRFVAGLTRWESIGWNLVAKLGAEVVSSFFVQCVFEACAQQDNMETACRMVQESLDYCYLTCKEPHLCFRPQTAYDCYVVGFCIATGGYTWNLDLNSLEGDEIIEMLGYGLTFTGSIRGSICKLNLAHCGLTRQATIHFSKFPPEVMRQITDLDLCDNDNIIDRATLSYFVSSNLNNLEMIDVNIDLTDLHFLCELFGSRSNLRNFKVGDETMTDECVAKLVEIVLLPSSLKELELWFPEWTSESANKFNLLRTNRNLISVEFHKCFVGFDEVVSVVAEALKENKTMKKLSMSQIYCIGIDLIDKLSNMLEVNQTLEMVEMNVQYGCLSISTIASVLQRDKSRSIQMYIDSEGSVCSRCATLDHRIQLSPELMKSAELRTTCNKVNERIDIQLYYEAMAADRESST
jgi:hypothetical protein